MTRGTKKSRAKGTGHIFKRGNIYYLQYDVNGKRKRISLKCNTEREAKARASDFLKPVIEAKSKEEITVHIAKARNIIKEGKVPLENVWSLYDKSPGRPDSSEGTMGNYKRMWERFKKWLEGNYPQIHSLAQVTEGIAKEYAASLWGTKLSANTYNYHIQALRLVTRVLKADAVLENNPWESIVKKSENKQTRNEFTENEVLTLLSCFDDANLKITDKDEIKTLFHLGIWTGLRLVDCALMEWKNVNFERKIIVCKPQKTKRKTQRIVNIPIHPTLEEELLSALGGRVNEYILPKISERYLKNNQSVKKDISKVFQYANFETTKEVSDNIQRKRRANVYGFHSFRHSFVSFCAKAGVPLPVVQSIVGHGNPAITRHYIHIGEDSVKQAIMALPGGDPTDKPTSKETNKNSPDKQIEEALAFLNSRKTLTKTEKKVMEILTGK